MFTTQHYSVLAATFNAELREAWCDNEPDAPKVYTTLKLAKRLATTLQGDNSLFDFDYFMNCVCLHTPYDWRRIESYNQWTHIDRDNTVVSNLNSEAEFRL
jgi:hypothetical protein